MINGLLLEVRGESCTEGFIDYRHLQSTISSFNMNLPGKIDGTGKSNKINDANTRIDSKC